MVLIAALLVVAYVLKATNFGTALNEAWIDAEIRGRGVVGELLFVGVGVLVTAVGVPRQLVAFLGGYAYGFYYGGLLGWAATVAGAMLSFYFARLFGRHLLPASLAQRARALDRLLHEQPFVVTLIVRLLPVGHNLLTNLAAGITRIRAWPFLAASALGLLPQNAVFALVGSGVSVDSTLQVVLAAALLFASGLLGYLLYRRHRRRRRGADPLDEFEAPRARAAKGR